MFVSEHLLGGPGCRDRGELALMVKRSRIPVLHVIGNIFCRVSLFYLLIN